MNKLLLIILTIAVNLFFNNCTVQKRLYRKGYYIELSSFRNNKPAVSSTQQVSKHLLTQISTLPTHLIDLRKNTDSIRNVYAHTSTTQRLQLLSKEKNCHTLSDTCGDKIILKSGDDYIVKIIEITDNEIKYKRCDNLNGPLYSINKSKVYLIIYSNGVKEHIIADKYQNSSTVQDKKDNKNKTYPPSYTSAMLWFLSSFFIYFIGLYITMFAARRARRDIKQNPNKYKGLGEMTFLMYLSFILNILVTLFAIFLALAMISFGSNYQIFVAVVIFTLIPIAAFIYTSKKGDFY